MHLAVKICILNAALLLQAYWARLAIANVGLGLPRLIMAAPTVVANLLLPLIFNPVHEIVVLLLYLIVLTWLANFKVC